ncbi:hypothetical protein SEMRO_2050_G312590.1 [Seminavis robusta]|uniref:Uncharacterized protein n=1 Tax=Seminavis robusta TaxID=568900 RepID=A0A9N8EY57_9STRA|nr:hypothetical protein SEMRO_2050_G312590.1 [Seminavis robusta]|eukprot:Sro2050_g312590.1 n/a (424) ;mRNA; f:6987-8386
MSWSDIIGSSTKLGNKIVKGLIKEFAPTQNPLQDPVPEDNDLLQQQTNKVTPQTRTNLESEKPNGKPKDKENTILIGLENEMDPEEQLEETGTTTKEHPNELTEEEEATATAALMNNDTNGKSDSQDSIEQPNKPGNPGSTPSPAPASFKDQDIQKFPLYALTSRLKSLDSGTNLQKSLWRTPEEWGSFILKEGMETTIKRHSGDTYVYPDPRAQGKGVKLLLRLAMTPPEEFPCFDPRLSKFTENTFMVRLKLLAHNSIGPAYATLKDKAQSPPAAEPDTSKKSGKTTAKPAKAAAFKMRGISGKPISQSNASTTANSDPVNSPTPPAGEPTHKTLFKVNFPNHAPLPEDPQVRGSVIGELSQQLMVDFLTQLFSNETEAKLMRYPTASPLSFHSAWIHLHSKSAKFPREADQFKCQDSHRP